MKPENTGGGEMKTLQNVKEDLAHEYGFKSWRDMYLYTLMSADELIDEVAKRYAAEAIKGFAQCITQIVGPEGKHKGWLVDVAKGDKFLKDNNLINELK